MIKQLLIILNNSIKSRVNQNLKSEENRDAFQDQHSKIDSIEYEQHLLILSSTELN